MRLAEHLMSLRAAWCNKQCLPSRWKPEVLWPGIVVMRGSTAAMHDNEYSPPPPGNANLGFRVWFVCFLRFLKTGSGRSLSLRTRRTCSWREREHQECERSMNCSILFFTALLVHPPGTQPLPDRLIFFWFCFSIASNQSGRHYN